MRYSSRWRLHAVALPLVNYSPYKGIPMFNEWFALAVKPRLSRITVSLLQNRGLEAFLPCYSINRKWSDRVREVQLPLFPGYVFCRFDLMDRLPVLMTPGVNNIVGYGKQPKAIADDEIFNIKKSLESGLLLQPWPHCKVGERVTITSGPLRGVSGTLVRVHNTARLIVSVSVIESAFTVQVSPSCVAAEELSVVHALYA